MLVALTLFSFCFSTLRAAEIGEPLPAFQVTTMDGVVIDSTAIVGKKPLFIFFWASWCPVCKEEIPLINRLAKEFGPQGMEFISINVAINDSEKKARHFMEKYQMRYPVFFDKEYRMTREFKIIGTPTIIIADKSGIIRFRQHTTPSNLAAIFPQLNH
jgi:thiol-disulfide isomerase/thioredoxin